VVLVLVVLVALEEVVVLDHIFMHTEGLAVVLKVLLAVEQQGLLVVRLHIMNTRVVAVGLVLEWVRGMVVSFNTMELYLAKLVVVALKQ
tara:strand:+ start:401 stop:667 length:267 start_codon:yes stop_codon:yes gene_type:complete